MRIADRGTAIPSDPDSGRGSCAFPGLCVLPNGRWLCTCRAAPNKERIPGQTVLVSWSDDQGRSWSEPQSPFGPRSVDGKPGVHRTCQPAALGGTDVLAAVSWVDQSDPSLPFFNEETEGLLDMRIFLVRSGDGGETWAEPEIVDTTPFNMPTPTTGPVLLLPDGEWACQFELNKHYLETHPWRHSSVLMFSKDQGKTWCDHVRVSDDPELRVFWWDQRPEVLSDGRILDVFWTFDRVSAKYLNIHARESLDNGRTWSDMWDTGVPGQPAPPVSLPNGRIAMVYVDRTAEPKIKVRVSSDRGRSWPDETEGVIHDSELDSQTWNKGSMQDAWAEMGKFSLGLPVTAGLEDGGLLVAYYSGPHQDATNVEWARLLPDD